MRHAFPGVAVTTGQRRGPLLLLQEPAGATDHAGRGLAIAVDIADTQQGASLVEVQLQFNVRLDLGRHPLDQLPGLVGVRRIPGDHKAPAAEDRTAPARVAAGPVGHGRHGEAQVAFAIIAEHLGGAVALQLEELPRAADLDRVEAQDERRLVELAGHLVEGTDLLDAEVDVIGEGLDEIQGLVAGLVVDGDRAQVRADPVLAVGVEPVQETLGINVHADAVKEAIRADAQRHTGFHQLVPGLGEGFEAGVSQMFLVVPGDAQRAAGGVGQHPGLAVILVAAKLGGHEHVDRDAVRRHVVIQRDD